MASMRRWRRAKVLEAFSKAWPRGEFSSGRQAVSISRSQIWASTLVSEAAELPVVADEDVDVVALFGADGVEAFEVFGGEGLEGGGVFAADDFGLSVDSGLEGVHGAGGFALSGAWAGGFLGVEAIGLDLLDGCHGGPRVAEGGAGVGRKSVEVDEKTQLLRL